MKHIDQHTLELYVLKSDKLELSSRQIKSHLVRCAGCRELHEEIVRFYENTREDFARSEEPTTSATEALVHDRVNHAIGQVNRHESPLSPVPRPFVSIVRYVQMHRIAAGIGTLAVGSALWALTILVPSLISDQNPSYASLNSAVSKLEVYNKANEKLWDVPVTGIESARMGEKRDLLPRVVVTDLEGDGRNEVIATLESIGGFKGKEGGTVLVAFSSAGKVYWQKAPGSPVRFRGEDYSNTWLHGGMLVKDFGGDGRKEIICRTLSARSPSAILRFSSEGNVLGEYWHYGHLLSLQTIDLGQDSGVQLLVGGRSDSEGSREFDFASVLVLDARMIAGISEATMTAGFGYAPSNAERVCVRLPNTSINKRYRSKPEIESIIVDTLASKQAVRVWWRAELDVETMTLEYIFGPDMTLKSIKTTDNTTRLLRSLQNRGEISSREVEQLLPSLQSSVEYWDGRKWGTKLTILADSRR